MKTIDLQVEGMSCGSCVKHVTQALQPLPGVQWGRGRSPVWPCPGERGAGAGQRSFADGLNRCGLPRKAGHRCGHFYCEPRSLKPRAATAAAREAVVADDGHGI
jgi:hypothetical protein